MSRKPSVISSAVFAPVRSRIVLIAIVEPCRNKAASSNRVPAFSIPASMPPTSASAVDSALPNLSLPLASSKAAISVKVPPISAASLKLAVLDIRRDRESEALPYQGRPRNSSTGAWQLRENTYGAKRQPRHNKCSNQAVSVNPKGASLKGGKSGQRNGIWRDRLSKSS